MIACSEEASKQSSSSKEYMEGPVAFWIDDSLGKLLIDTNYVKTGFYFLAKGSEPEIRMRKENSNEIYAIRQTPIATVHDVVDVYLKNLPVEGTFTTDLCLSMSEKGARNIRMATEDTSHSYVAVVIANRLLYVVRNNVSSKTEIMCIGLDGYTEEEMQEMLEAVKSKR